MTTIQKLVIICSATLVILMGCSSDLAPLPTPTPVDVALQRLNQPTETTEPPSEAQQSDPAASGESSSATGGESSNLEAVFAGAGCIACHAVTEDAPPGVGPNMVGLVDFAAKIIESPDYTGKATTVEEYIHESIVDPLIFVVPDYQPVMPATYQDTLTEEQISQLVEYLLTFK